MMRSEASSIDQAAPGAAGPTVVRSTDVGDRVIRRAASIRLALSVLAPEVTAS